MIRRMKEVSWLMLFSLQTTFSLAQVSDTIAVADSRSDIAQFSCMKSSVVSFRSADTVQRWVVISREHVAFKKQNVVLTETETKIIDLESLECGAVKKRDNLALMGLWARDFTLDEKQDALVKSSNALPYYATLKRMIENITELDANTVVTSEYELFQKVKEGLEVETEHRQNFFHVWSRKNRQWKLTARRSTSVL